MRLIIIQPIRLYLRRINTIARRPATSLMPSRRLEPMSAYYYFDDPDQMLFPVDLEDPIPPSSPTFHPLDHDVKPMYDYSPSSPSFVCDPSQSSPTDSGYYESMDSYSMRVTKNSPPPDTQQFLSNWIHDSDLALPPPSSPIPIPSSIPQSPSFSAFAPLVPFPLGSPFSPTEYAALHPLPRSMSPSSSQDHYSPQQHHLEAISPQDMSLHTPSWASLWESHQPVSPSSPTRTSRPSPIRDATVRQRLPSYRGSISSGQPFQSMSAPSTSDLRSPGITRSYSRRAESAAITDDHDATIRRKKRSLHAEDSTTPPKAQDHRKFLSPIASYFILNSPVVALKSVLRPPKLAPSAWQLYFTDWIQNQQASGTRKLNVAQAAKEAGQEYALLTAEQKEVSCASKRKRNFIKPLLHSLINDVRRRQRKHVNGSSPLTCVL